MAKPEITRSGRVTPFLRPGNVVGPQRHWGVGRDDPLCQPRRGRELGGWDRAGNSQRAPSAEASDLGALPFGRRPQPPLSCNLLLNHASF